MARPLVLPATSTVDGADSTTLVGACALAPSAGWSRPPHAVANSATPATATASDFLRVRVGHIRLIGYAGAHLSANRPGIRHVRFGEVGWVNPPSSGDFRG